jgi:hypothetical protein
MDGAGERAAFRVDPPVPQQQHSAHLFVPGHQLFRGAIVVPEFASGEETRRPEGIMPSSFV